MPDHRNAFGFLRLVLASLVILSHTPELVDGNRHRELLTLAFGTLSFGELAVDGFFIISGYLITDSFLRSPRVGPYAARRVGRIYPAFIVASLFCLLVVAPLAGAPADPWRGGYALLRMALLLPPVAPGAFAGAPYPDLDGAMWTIAYEFRCYILVVVLGLCGLLRRPRVVALLAAACLGAYELADPRLLAAIDARLPLGDRLFGFTASDLRLTGAFLTGAAFLLYRERLVFSPPVLGAAAVLLLAVMPLPRLAEPGLCLLGGYLLFAAAKLGGGTILARINNRTDISYGVYLYAWPVEMLLKRLVPQVPLVPLGLATWLIACLIGFVSWKLVEQPVLALVRRWPGRGAGLRPAGAPAT